ncbi:hypothetical protein CkaCkLH20_10970 [Colletotrichum karsti]|uniref:Uncharacterized protein n=1 Tax=Colletotrichum karsti TaxID=1095194 RepID=A0A9P6LDE7_9PEZI|nr:uncharacterized protein CkaCkLH20_10970 [Colletotrichum karsti]KAF9871559.1 hypothetical protein CkaCkLH20_10970 [Colletotrichum karsti]
MSRTPRACDGRECACHTHSDNIVDSSSSLNTEGNNLDAANLRQYLLEEGRGQHREITTVSQNDRYDADNERPVGGFAASHTFILSEYESNDDAGDEPNQEVNMARTARPTSTPCQNSVNDTDHAPVDETPASLYDVNLATLVGDADDDGLDEVNIAGGGDDSDESTIDGSDDESLYEATIVGGDDDIWEELDDGSWVRMNSRLREAEFLRHIRDLERLSPHESDEEEEFGFYFDHEQVNFDSQMA